MESVHDSIMATMFVTEKKKRLDDEIEQEGHEHTHTYIERKWQTDDYEYALHDTVPY